MAPRRPKVELSNIAAGLLIAAVAGFAGRFVFFGDSVSALQARADYLAPQRNREIDQLIARVAALEERCRE